MPPRGQGAWGHWTVGQPAAGLDQGSRGTSPGGGTNSQQGPLRKQAEPGTFCGRSAEDAQLEAHQRKNPRGGPLRGRWLPFRGVWAVNGRTNRPGCTTGGTAQLRARTFPGQRGTQTELEDSHRDVTARVPVGGKGALTRPGRGSPWQRLPSEGRGKQLSPVFAASLYVLEMVRK